MMHEPAAVIAAPQEPPLLSPSAPPVQGGFSIAHTKAPVAAQAKPADAPVPVVALNLPEHKRNALGTLIWLVVLGALGYGGYWAYQQYKTGAFGSKPTTAPTTRPVPVVVSTARRGDMDIYLTGLGSVTALNTVTIRTRIDGQIDRVFFTEGELVHQGQLLIQIDPRPYEAALAQVQATLAKDQATLDNAKLDLQRDIEAAEAIPKQQLDTQRSLVTQLDAALKSDQAQIKTAELNLVYTHITAPITGRIGLRLVDTGNMVHASDANGLAVITQVQPISVVFSLEEDNIPQIIRQIQPRPDGAFEFMLPDGVRHLLNSPILPVLAYDRDLQHRIAAGSLLAIDSQIDPTSGTVRLKGIFTNSDDLLFPNQFVNARLLINVRRDAVLVPTAAIQRSPAGDFVYVVEGLPQGWWKMGGGRGAGGPGGAGRAGMSGAGMAGGTPHGEGQGGSMADGKPVMTVAPTTQAQGAGDAPKPPQGAVAMRPVVVGPTEGNYTIIESGLSAGGSRLYRGLIPSLIAGNCSWIPLPVKFPSLRRQPREVLVTDGVDKLLVGSMVIPRIGKNDDSASDDAPKVTADLANNTPTETDSPRSRRSKSEGGASDATGSDRKAPRSAPIPAAPGSTP